MPVSHTDARMKQLHADDPMISVRMLQTAMVHLALRATEKPPMRTMPDPPGTLSTEATRFELVRKLASFLGQPERCRSRECRRAKICHGDPPDCWRDEPPPTPEEIDLAKGLVKYHLRALLGNPATWDEDHRDRIAK